MPNNNQYNQIDRLVIIDANVPDCQILADGVIAGTATVLLDASRDGIIQIGAVLAQYPTVNSLHVISHGSPGCIYLGNTELSLTTLERYTEAIATWTVPQILFYGCQVAAGDAGTEFLDKLQQISGAAIAASNTLTGNATQGGNWQLEASTSEMAIDLALDATTMKSYQHTLVTINGDSTFDGNIFNTGYDAVNGGLQSPSLDDAVWEVSNLIVPASLLESDPTKVNTADWKPADVVNNVGEKPGVWVNTSTTLPRSQWISYQADEATPPTNVTAHEGNKDLYFRYKFDLTGFDPTAFALQLDFYADNDVYEIYVNGVKQSPNVPSILTNNGDSNSPNTPYKALGYTSSGKLAAELKNNWKTGANEIIVHVKSGATRIGFLADFDATKIKPIVDLDSNNSSGTNAGNYKNTFTAGGSSVNIVDSDIKILDNTQTDTTKKQVQTATITLTNAQAGDLLVVGTLPAGITATTDTSVSGKIVVTLSTTTGTGSLNDYIAALQTITFNNNIGNDPDNTDRLIDIKITDGNGNVNNTATSTITVLDAPANQPPVIGSDGAGDTATKNTPENTTVVTKVTSTDPDVGDTLAYSIVGGTDGAKFQIDVQGNLSFLTAPNFEAPTDSDANNSYEVKVQVADGKGGIDTQTITVNVGNANEPPVIGSDGAGDTATKNTPENTTVVTKVTSTDPDVGDTLTYSIVGGTDGAKFQIDAQGNLSFLTAPNFEAPTDSDANNSYEVKVQVADGKGGIDTQTITVNVGNANEPPVITSDGAGDTATKNTPENTTVVTKVTSTDPDVGDTLTYSIVGGMDGAKFQIDAQGNLSFLTAPNFEAPTDSDANNSYEVKVQVADGKGGIDTQTLTVNVSDVNETIPNQPPVIGSDGAGDTATKNTPENTTVVTKVTSTDPDVGDTLTYSIVGGTDGAKFQIDAQGNLSFLTAPNFEAPTDSDANNSYEVKVQVADGKGGIDTQTITVNVGDVNETLPNLPPIINSGNSGQPVVVSTPEDNIPVPYKVTASDPNGDPLTYSINPEVGDGSLFTIDPQGNIAFKTAPDFELPSDGDGNNSYTLQVLVSDGKGGTAAQDVTVNVTDIDENAPVVSIATNPPTKDTTPPLTGTIDDPNADVTVTINGKDYPAINNGDGTWTIPDNTIDPLPGNGNYPTKVTAVDEAGNSAVDEGVVVIDASTPTVTVNAKRTNDGTPELTGAIDDPNAVIKVTVNGTEYTATNNGNTWTLANDTIATALASNTYDVKATATDAAGNVGTDTSTNELVIDTTAIDVTLNPNNGKDSTPTLTGTVSKPNAEVKVKIGDREYPAVNNGDGTWTLAGEGIDPALADGTYPVMVTAIDDLGNTGSTDGNLTIDNTPPTVTVNTLVTNDNTPTLTGTVSEPVTKLEVIVDGKTYEATVNGNDWTIANDTIAPPLADNTYDVTATATDLSGNVGTDTTSGELTIDTTPPNPPTITSPNLTDDTTPKIEGGADANTDVLVSLDTDNDGNPDTTYSTRSDSQGKWAIDLDTAIPFTGPKPVLKNGDRIGVTAIALDPLGNRSDRAQQILDIIPLATVVDDTIDANLSGKTVIDVLANDEGNGLKIVSFTQPTNGGSVDLDDNGTPDDLSDDQLLYTPPVSGLSLQRNGSQNVFQLVGSSGNNPSFVDTFTYTVEGADSTTNTASVNVNVPAGSNGGASGLEFMLTGVNALCRNEIGVFTVDDDAGTINGIAPNDPNYLATALASGRSRTIFSAVNGQVFDSNPTRILSGFNASDRLNFFLIQNDSVDGVLADLEAGNATVPVYFGTPNSNENTFNSVQVGDIQDGFTLDWEDFGSGSDKDYNDLSLQVKLSNTSAPIGSSLQGGRETELIDLTSTTTTTSATFQVSSDAAFNNTVGFYRVENAEGTIIDEVTGASLNPSDAGYSRIAVRQSINALNRGSNDTTGDFQNGGIYAPVLISNGTFDEFIAQNPDNNQSNEDVIAYFNYLGANIDGIDHIRLLGDNTFGFEDVFRGGDLDYNDIVVKVNF